MCFVVASVAMLVVVVMLVFKLFQGSGRDRREPLPEFDGLAVLGVEIGTPPILLIIGHFVVRRHAATRDDLFQSLHPLR